MAKPIEPELCIEGDDAKKFWDNGYSQFLYILKKKQPKKLIEFGRWP